MSLPKLTAGSGYDYLTHQVPAMDATDMVTERMGRPVVSVEELRAAWCAAQEGRFRASRERSPRATLPLAAGEQLLPVVGVAGSVGATTVAVAVGLAATARGWARVVECASSSASGLAAAAAVELGASRNVGWRLGRREGLELERVVAPVADLGSLPDFPVAGVTGLAGRPGLTVLDAGWPVGQLAVAQSWLGEVVRVSPLVLVTVATVPGMRQLEVALDLLAPAEVVVAVVGPSKRRRWPRGVAESVGPGTAALFAQQRVCEVPREGRLEASGLSSSPLPSRVLAAGERLLGLVDRSGEPEVQSMSESDSVSEDLK